MIVLVMKRVEGEADGSAEAAAISETCPVGLEKKALFLNGGEIVVMATGGRGWRVVTLDSVWLLPTVVCPVGVATTVLLDGGWWGWN